MHLINNVNPNFILEGNQFAVSQKAKFIEVSAVLDHKIPELLLTIITHLRELDEAKSQRPKRPPTTEMWGTSRKISVKMACSGIGGSSSADVSGVLKGDSLSRLGKKPAKKEIVKFFKKHFSKSVIEERDGRDYGSG